MWSNKSQNNKIFIHPIEQTKRLQTDINRDSEEDRKFHYGFFVCGAHFIYSFNHPVISSLTWSLVVPDSIWIGWKMRWLLQLQRNITKVSYFRLMKQNFTHISKLHQHSHQQQQNTSHLLSLANGVSTLSWEMCVHTV